MIKQGTWAQITYFKNLQYFFIFLHILVALYRTFLNHLQLCLYDQNSQSYEAFNDGFSIF